MHCLISTAHPTDIYSLSTTRSQILSVSGSSSIQVHASDQPDFPLFQTLEGAHKLGCHHIATSKNGQTTASVGFGGEVKTWAVQDDGRWTEKIKIVGANFLSLGLLVSSGCGSNFRLDGNKAGEIWALALSEDGQYLAATAFDGRINVWDTLAAGSKIREFETKGSFGMSIALV